MKSALQDAKSLFPIVAFALLGAGCAGIPRTDLNAVRLSQPPPGKALVNFHRPSGWGGNRALPIFDGNGKMLVDLPGEAMYQKVCDPGEHVFVAWADHVSVVQADLAPDKIYDIVVDVSLGWVQANIFLSPMDKNDSRRPRLAEFERREKRTVSINPASPRTVEYEAAHQQHLAEIKSDFFGGAKSDRVRHLQKDDCR
jgi:hypothetical protein